MDSWDSDTWLIGGVAAGVVLLAVLVGVVPWIRRGRRKRRELAQELLMSTGEMRDLSARVNALLAHNSIQPAAARAVRPPPAEASVETAESSVEAELSPLIVATLDAPEAVVEAATVIEAEPAVEAMVEVEAVVEAVVIQIPAQRAPRDVELLSAVVANRPQWLPAKPLRESLIKTASLAHGVRHALSADVRDRIAVEMQLEVRRSRRHRKEQMKALRKYLRGTGGRGSGPL